MGTETRSALVVSGVPDALLPLLHTLDGRHTTAELLARAGSDQGTLLDVLTGLAELGLVEDANHPSAGYPARLAADRTAWTLRAGPPTVDVAAVRQRAAVVVHGSGRVGVAVATLLAAAGVGWVQPVPDGLVQPEDTGCGYLDADVGTPRPQAAVAAVHRAASGVRTDRLPVTRRPDVVVLADRLVADPQVSAGLLADGIPHLSARAAEGAGLVGPLVLPGRSGCLRCLDLHNTAVDDRWPVVATQLAASSRPADLCSAQATAAFAVGQVLRLLHQPSHSHQELPTWNTVIELDTFAGESHRIPAPPHPQCPCAAGRRAGTAQPTRVRTGLGQ